MALAQNCKQRWALEKHGFKSSQISSEIRILGIDFVSYGKDGGRTAQSRVSAALKLTDKLCTAPIPVDVKRDLFRTRVIPLASWGWWLFDIPKKFLNQLFARFRKVVFVHGMCSRDLRVLLEGHRQCPWFMSLVAWQTSFRHTRRGFKPPLGLTGFIELSLTWAGHLDPMVCGLILMKVSCDCFNPTRTPSCTSFGLLGEG